MNNKSLVLNYLKEGHSLTAFDGFNLFHIVSIRDYISMLKRDGVPIISEWRENNGKRFKVYKLMKEVQRTFA